MSDLRTLVARALESWEKSPLRSHDGRLYDDMDDLRAALAAEQPQPRTTEQHIALREAHEIAAERDYFNARPQITNNGFTTMLFEAGFRRGFDAGAEVYAAPPPPAPAEQPKPEPSARVAPARDSRCDYVTPAGKPCRKCGRVHDGGRRFKPYGI